MKLKILTRSALLVLVYSAAGTQTAYAYIDPNTGGLVFQILAVIFAFLSTILLVFSARIKMAWARGRRLVRNWLGSQHTASGETPVGQASPDTEALPHKTAHDELGQD